MDTQTPEQKLQELREITELEKQQRTRKLQLVRELLPKGQEAAPRGRLKAVSEASGWTREHVANIRDGKVTE